jgi:hypothetical protein
MSSTRFNGLSMPVFTAFGWAGEEQALKYALSELENFINALYESLPKDTQALFPTHGLDAPNESVYLKVDEEPDEGLVIAYSARPMNLEIKLGIANKGSLSKAYKAADGRPEAFHDLLTALGPDWIVRIQQMEYDPETKAATHYQDLYKNSIANLTVEVATEALDKAAFLNGEEKWVVPIHVSHRRSSEKVATMGKQIIPETLDEMSRLMPLVRFLTGKVRKPKKKAPSRKRLAVEDTPTGQPADVANLERFVYVSLVRPLHIRRGFVNLTPEHWPFFAINNRTETRQVTLNYGTDTDDKSKVWRLVQESQVRIVLSPAAHKWVENNFEPNDLLQVTAAKADPDRIVIKLETAV